MLEPQLLLLDEPTGSIDTYQEKEILAQIQSYLDEDPQRTLIVATHRKSPLSLVSRVMVLEDGQIGSDRPTEQVLARKPKSPVVTSAVKRAQQLSPAIRQTEPRLPVAQPVVPGIN